MLQPETIIRPALTITRQQLESGQGIICSTTGQAFAPLSYQIVRAGARAFAWIYCSSCDTHRRTRPDPEFDPLQPQSHCYAINEGG